MQLTWYTPLGTRLASLPAALSRLGAEVRAQRDALVYPGFFTRTSWTHLQSLPRYLMALDRRLAKYGERPDRDAKHAEQMAVFWQRYRERADRTARAGRGEPALEEFRWLVEEYRVSIFAPELRAVVPVSPQRLADQWKGLVG